MCMYVIVYTKPLDDMQNVTYALISYSSHFTFNLLFRQRSVHLQLSTGSVHQCELVHLFEIFQNLPVSEFLFISKEKP